MNGAHHLTRVFWSRGFSHPTWFVRIVERIARRRFVSFEEIDGRILDWYSSKHNYPKQWIGQHGINKQLYPYWARLGGVIGSRHYADRLWRDDPHDFGHMGLHCKLDKQGRRIDSQHCEICGAGINPVWNGTPKHRLTCRSVTCHAIYAWWHRKSLAGEGARLWRAVEIELRPIVLLWWFLDYQTKQRAK